MRVRIVIGAAAALALALSGTAQAADGVVALFDTGINPYHRTFRDTSPRAYRHPSTYLPGYPKDAEALKLSLDEPDYKKAVKQDCQVWEDVQPGKLYWIPGTKIVGAISFRSSLTRRCGSGPPVGNPILDDNGHGTMTASRATSREYGACRECLVVEAQWSADLTDGASEYPRAIDWLTANSRWIDADSHSWGPYVFGAWEPTGAAGQLVVGDPTLARKAEAEAKRHLAFWASGNGAAGRFGVVGPPTEMDPQMTPSVISVGG